ncbi:MAG: HAMP domain-containing protein [Acidimicrobiia bacterium]|nr:HAMP domain-containing protein [Acidimicrobiia bacterium]
MRTEVAEIGATDLHRRVPVSRAKDEIGRLAETMNMMLGRLESSVERQQRFIGDASNELRSPLARMRSEIEVDLATGKTNADVSRLRSLRDETIALQRLVDDLLLLARLDADQLPVRTEPVDLDDLIFREVQRLRADGRRYVGGFRRPGTRGSLSAGEGDQKPERQCRTLRTSIGAIHPRGVGRKGNLHYRRRWPRNPSGA